MRFLKLAAMAAVLALSAPIGMPAAADYPEEPITVVVPNNPGGSTDRVARLFADELQRNLGVPVTVVNKPGGGTSVGARFVKDADPDGYTLLMVHQAMLTAGATGISDFGPDAFEVVGLTGVDPSIIIVNAHSPYQTLDDLMEAARENPETIKAGVNIGALNHFALMAVEEAGDGAFRFVHTGGGGPSTTALLGGHIDVTYLTLSDAQQYHEAGDLRILAVFLPERHEAAPDLPTAIEQGYDLYLPIKHMWWMPEGTPNDRVETLANALEDAMDAESVQETFKQSLTVPRFASGAELQEELDIEFARIEKLAENVDLSEKN